MTSDESVEKIVSVCSETQSMINIAAKQLFGLRQCRETVDLIREEISESESKLALLFGKLLIAKAKLEDGTQLKDFAKIGQWLDIVGIGSSLSEKVGRRYLSLPDLLQSDKDSIERELKFLSASEEEVQLLATAMKQLKRAIDLLSHDPKLCVNGNWSTAELHWSNFKPSQPQQTTGVGAFSATYGRGIGQHHGSSPKFQNHHQHPTSGTHRPQISGAEPTGIPPSGRQSPQVSSSQFADLTDQSASEFGHPVHAQYPSSFPNARSTPPSTPQVGKTPRGGKFPTTPPPKRRNKLNPDSFQPLMKSTSHESQLSLKVSQDSKTSRHPKKKPSNINIVGSSEAISAFSPMKHKASGAPDEAVGPPGAKASGQSSPILSSPYRSPQLGKASCEDASVQESNFRMNQLAVPPVSPGNQFMTNSITHKLKKSKLLWGTCDVCRKQLIRGRLCKNCRLKFHNDCVSKAPSICKFYHSFIKHDEDSPELHHQSRHQQLPHQRCQQQQQQQQQHQQHHHLQQQQQHFDSSSTPSSCNSSTPSSPAVPTSTLSSSTHWTPQQQNFNITHFTYPEPSSGVGSSLSSSSTPTVSVSAADAVNTNTSTDSDKSDKTITGSGDSSGDQNLNSEHFDSIDGSEDLNLRRDNSISVALKEWDIPYQELNVLDAIGEGRFGKVHKGYWHGEVAIKLLNTNPNSEDHAQQLHAFKLEVANLRKTRHENLVLFMGACMDPEHLAIVTSFVKGQTLFSKIYLRKEKFLTNQTIAIASQIAQGLGYLHAKGIVHKDLKTKNVFVENLKPSSTSSENFKVVIGDFGLFSVSKLCQGRGKGQWLSIPHCWLCYLSPEIVKSLTPRSPFDDELPFTKESDIFAFGTVWFELLAGDWPYRAMRPEAIIWMVGKGVNQPHLNVQSEFKEILLQCWAFQPDSRPNCQQLLKILEKLPRKRLARSPSHPIQLSRSAESIF